MRGEILLISTTEDSASDVSPSDADHFDRTTYMISRMEREEQQQEEATRLVAAAALAPAAAKRMDWPRARASTSIPV